MADYTVTAASVSSSGGLQRQGTSGEAIDAGTPVYRHTDGKYYKADNTTSAKAAVEGITINGAAAADQPIAIQSGGSIDIGSAEFTLMATPVYLSANAGKMCPYADLTSSSYVTLIGLSGEVGDTIHLSINATGLLHDSVAA